MHKTMWLYNDVPMERVELCWASVSLCVKLNVCVVQLFTLTEFFLVLEVTINITR